MAATPHSPPSAPPGAGLSIALAGSGGSGVMTAGTLLLQAAAQAGLYGLMVRTSGPQIRGGEAAALIRLSPAPTQSLDDGFHMLLALDWQNVHRFADEIPLEPGALLIGDADEGEAPEVFKAHAAHVITLPLKKMAKAIPGSWINMLALGLAGAWAGLPDSALEGVLQASWKRSAESLQANLNALRRGIEAAKDFPQRKPLPARLGVGTVAGAGAGAGAGRWLISGNEAAGFGAVRGGVRFVAAYPITPATELLEWMAPALTQVGGSLLQAEDELASVNMIIGASFGGVPSLTATAGPGLSLMTEAIGLAITAEVPITVVDVMRGGPSTGIPAKSEQSDLSYAVNGLHGDAPRIVVAPSSIGDCLAATQWAVQLAEGLQTAAIVLSDQFMGQSRAIVDAPPRDEATVARRLVAEANAPDYKRYRDTASGVSPMAIPGTPGITYTADGLEHTEVGVPSSQAKDHRVQLDKRERKLMQHDYGPRWADIEGEGTVAVITFGSASGPAREAVQRVAALGLPVKLIVVRLLAPVQPHLFDQALLGVDQVLVVEQNHGAQLYRYLRSMVDLPRATQSFHKPGPLPLRPGEIATWIAEQAAALQGVLA